MPKLNLAHIHLHQQPDGTREICVAPEYLAHGAQAAAYYQARDTTPVALRITTAFLPFEQRQHENQSAENLNFAALAHCPALQRLSFSEYRARQYSNLAALYALRTSPISPCRTNPSPKLTSPNSPNCPNSAAQAKATRTT